MPVLVFDSRIVFFCFVPGRYSPLFLCLLLELLSYHVLSKISTLFFSLPVSSFDLQLLIYFLLGRRLDLFFYVFTRRYFISSSFVRNFNINFFLYLLAVLTSSCSLIFCWEDVWIRFFFMYLLGVVVHSPTQLYFLGEGTCNIYLYSVAIINYSFVVIFFNRNILCLFMNSLSELLFQCIMYCHNFRNSPFLPDGNFHLFMIFFFFNGKRF